MLHLYVFFDGVVDVGGVGFVWVDVIVGSTVWDWLVCLGWLVHSFGFVTFVHTFSFVYCVHSLVFACVGDGGVMCGVHCFEP